MNIFDYKQSLIDGSEYGYVAISSREKSTPFNDIKNPYILNLFGDGKFKDKNNSELKIKNITITACRTIYKNETKFYKCIVDWFDDVTEKIYSDNGWLILREKVSLDEVLELIKTISK